jgi:hypothetical protein
MSWVDWVNGYIINHTESSGEVVYAICRRGVIACANTGAVWGEVNFNFHNYELSMEDDNDQIVKGQVDEFKSLLNAWSNKGKCTLFGGIRFNNEKFVLSRFDEDTETMYLTNPDGGCCVAKSEKCFVIGVYYKAGDLVTSSGNTRVYANVNAINAVENCRNKLVDAGF